MGNLTKNREIWGLGDNLLVLGDATKIETLEGWLGFADIKIRSVITDPPYGVAYVENKDWLGIRGTESKHFQKHKKIAGDQIQSNQDYKEFTKQWIEVAKRKLADKNQFYIFNSDKQICELKQAMEECELYYSQLIIWIKNSIVLGRKDYNPQHELIVYGWYGSHKFERRKSRSVLCYPKPNRSVLHPTMKPVGLLRKLILNSAKIGEWVYDPFGGSGSTLIACEQTKRKCLMVEIEPDYIKTIIQRWEKLTKLKAKKIK